MNQDTDFNLRQNIVHGLCALTISTSNIASLRTLLKQEIRRLKQRRTALAVPLNNITIHSFEILSLRISMLKMFKVWCDCMISAHNNGTTAY